MESYNAVLIGKGMEQKERMIELRNLARTQLMSLEKLNNTGIKSLEYKSNKQIYMLQMSFKIILFPIILLLKINRKCNIVK